MPTMLDLALLFPPVARWFIGLLLIVGVVTYEACFGLFIYMFLYGKEE